MNTPTITVTGNLTRDPELRYTPSGVAVANTGLAVNKRKRNTDGTYEDAGTDFYSVTAWRQLATNVAESLGKGARVVITGRQEIRTWEGDDKVTRTAVEITADEIGASLAFATVQVERNERRHPNQPPHPADDVRPTSNDGAPAYDPTEEPF